MSARLVAAITMTPVLPSKPSISVSSWLSVCSRSSLPPPTPVPRDRPTASISSTKTMQGAFSLACAQIQTLVIRDAAPEGTGVDPQKGTLVLIYT